MAKPMLPTKAWAVVNKITGCCIEVFQPDETREDTMETAMIAADERLARVTITEGDGWQPIETAPTNGKAVLLGAYKHLSWAGYWWPCGSDTQTGKPGWVDGSRDEHELFYVMEWPTHWQPLPASPRRKR